MDRSSRPLGAPHPCGLYDTHTTSNIVRNRCHVVLCLGSLDPAGFASVPPHVAPPASVVYILFCPPLHSSSLRSTVAAAAYHVPHRSIALLSLHTSQFSPLSVSVFPALYWSRLYFVLPFLW